MYEKYNQLILTHIAKGKEGGTRKYLISLLLRAGNQYTQHKKSGQDKQNVLRQSKHHSSNMAFPIPERQKEKRAVKRWKKSRPNSDFILNVNWLTWSIKLKDFQMKAKGKWLTQGQIIRGRAGTSARFSRLWALFLGEMKRTQDEARRAPQPCLNENLCC